MLSNVNARDVEVKLSPLACRLFCLSALRYQIFSRFMATAHERNISSPSRRWGGRGEGCWLYLFKLGLTRWGECEVGGGGNEMELAFEF